MEVDETTYATTGHQCTRGIEFGKNELINPMRTITSTVKISGAIHRRCPVKTAAPVPKRLIQEAMAQLDSVELTAPVALGQIIVENICGTGVSFISTRSM